MAEVKATFKGIEDLNVRSKVVVIDKDTNEKAIVTAVSFDLDADSSELTDVLRALAANHRVDVTFQSVQMMLDEPNKA